MTVALNAVAGALVGYVVVGDGVTFTATSSSGDWPATTRLRIANSAGVETAYTPVIATTLATWTLTVAEVTALVGTLTQGQLKARVTHGTGDDLRGILTGELSILTKWRGVRGTQSLGAVVVGPRGLQGETGPAGTSATVTADDTPAAPAEGEAASYFVTSAVVWPVGLVWSSEPDGDTEPAIAGSALVSLFTVDGTTYAVLGATFPAVTPPADTTAPTAGTLSVTAHASTTIDVSVSGAADETALHATPYAFSSDNGGTWGAYQAGATHQFTGLSPSTAYTVRHRVRDATGNVSTGTGVAQSTDAAADTTPPTAGTMAASSITSTGFVLTVSGAADETALHATPYDFTLDGGATWQGYQASAAYTASALTPGTGYSCNWRVRDAAGNVATGTAQTVTTEAAVTTLREAMLALSPTLFSKLDDAASPFTNEGSGGHAITSKGTPSFAQKSLADGTASLYSPSVNNCAQAPKVVYAGAAAVTISMLIELDAYPSTGYIFGDGGARIANVVIGGLGRGSVNGFGDVNFSNITNSDLALNTKYLITVTYDGSTIAYYRNATLIGTRASTGAVKNPTYDPTIGSDIGYMSHIMVINGTAITDAQVAVLATAAGVA